MANIIPLDHVDDLPVVKPNQPDVVPVIPKPVLVDEDEDPEEEEFEEEEEPQEEEDIDIDDEEDENEPELTFHYEEADHLNLLPPAFDLEPEDVIEVEDTVEPEDETVSASVHGVGTLTLWSRDGPCIGRKEGKPKDEYYGMLILDLGNEVRSSMEEGTAAMENLVRKLGNAKEGAAYKKLEKELEKSRIMPPKSAPLTQAVIRRMIRESVDVAIAAKRAKQANAGNNTSGSGQAKGTVKLKRWFEKTEMTFGISECAEDKKVKFAAATLRGPKLMTVEFCPAEELQRMENELWNLKVKEYNMVSYTQRFNMLALMCPRMVKPENVKIDAYIRGLSDNIKGEVTSSKPTNLNKAVPMAHNSGKINHKDNSRQSLQNNLKQGNARAMTTDPNEGKVSSFLYVNVVLLAMLVHERSNAISMERLGIKRAYTIKDAEPQSPNVVTGTFLLNNRYASILFDSSYDRSFVDTRFSSMLDIDPVKIDTSYEVELADERVVSTNTVLKGCTLNLVNHLFEIDLMPIELGTFDVIIGMDWIVKNDVVIVFGEKVVYIPYGNKTLIVESDKGVS
ncbi:putative reverse transcriptase domain-containing protein [Tanacetum coccineum]